jgi:hypothetical protein
LREKFWSWRGHGNYLHAGLHDTTLATKHQKSPQLGPGFLSIAKQRVKVLSGLVKVYYMLYVKGNFLVRTYRYNMLRLECRCHFTVQIWTVPG